MLGPRILSVDALYKLTFTYLLTYLLTYLVKYNVTDVTDSVLHKM